MGVFFDNLLVDLATIACVLVGLLYYYLTSTYSYWAKRKVPFIEPEIFYGNMKDIIQAKVNQLEKSNEFYKQFKMSGHKFGGIFQMREPVLLVCSPELIREMLIKNFPSFHNRGFVHDENFDPLTANLIYIEGQKWKYIRSKLTPTFSSGKLKKMLTLVDECAKMLVNRLGKASEKGEMLEMREVLAQYTTDVIGSCAFGLQFNSLEDEDSEFRKMGRKVFTPSSKEKFLQLIRAVYPWVYKTFKLRQYSQEMTDFFTRVIRETMQYRKENNIVRNDFLHYLMEMRHTKGADLKDLEEMKGVNNYNTSVDNNAIQLTDSILAAQAFVFFLAGFETSSTTMSFCLFELAKHPEMQETICDEVEEVMKKHGGLTYEALQDLKYMEQVLDETLRKYPPVPLLFRRCSKSYKVPDSDFVVEKGLMTFIPTYAFHHDPEFFPNPQKFDPERFSEENKKKLVPNTYLPFGEGPRVCIGLRFAMMEMKMGFAQFILKYRVVPCEKTVPIRFDPRLLIMASLDGIWLRVVPRKN